MYEVSMVVRKKGDKGGGGGKWLGGGKGLTVGIHEPQHGLDVVGVLIVEFDLADWAVLVYHVSNNILLLSTLSLSSLAHGTSPTQPDRDKNNLHHHQQTVP